MAGSETPSLSNHDFRKLLETPRAERAGSTPSNKPRTSQPKGEYKPKPKPSVKPLKKPERVKPKGDEEDDEDGGSKYRDRAEERRKGANPDYLDSIRQTDISSGSIDITRLSVEESKYLGGDIRTTHLVKGLDYQLAHKTREQQGLTEGDGAQADTAPKDQAPGTLARKDARITGPHAHAVWDVLLEPVKRGAQDMFLPRRTAFVYDFESEDAMDTDVPTTLRRTKADCPPVPDALFASVDSAVLQRIIKVVSYIKTTADGKRLKKKDRDALLGLAPLDVDGNMKPPSHPPGAPPAPQRGGGPAVPPNSKAKPGDDDDDIFGDVGTDYRPTRNPSKGREPAGPSPASRQAEARSGNASYFGVQDDMSDIPMPGTSIRGGQLPQGRAAEDDMDVEQHGSHYDQQHQPHSGAGGYSAYGAHHPGPPHAAGRGGYGYSADPSSAYYSQQQQAAYAYAGPQQYAMQIPSMPDPSLPAMARNDPSKWRTQRAGPRKMPEEEEEEDEYGAYFPTSGATVDSDEDADLSHMDNKQGKGQTRADFNTDEEWERYKEQKETLPKAAFQFGVKRSDGRKSHKALVASAGVAQANQKLDNQLRKIERIMTDKGQDHGDAFKRPPREAPTPRLGGLGKGGGGGATGGETPSMRKRMKL